jgi:ABC-type phosphate/phosphonate transport system ATPase subunit
MFHSIAERRPQIGPVTSEALARVTYLLQRPLGCGVVVGPARSGKSALLRQLATAGSRQGAQTAIVDGQGLDARGLTWELAAEWRSVPRSTGTAAD